MTRRIRRDDPAYDAAMAEAKAQFDDAMARGVMRGRHRPSKPTPVDAATSSDAADDATADPTADPAADRAADVPDEG